MRPRLCPIALPGGTRLQGPRTAQGRLAWADPSLRLPPPFASTACHRATACVPRSPPCPPPSRSPSPLSCPSPPTRPHQPAAHAWRPCPWAWAPPLQSGSPVLLLGPLGSRSIPECPTPGPDLATLVERLLHLPLTHTHQLLWECLAPSVPTSRPRAVAPGSPGQRGRAEHALQGAACTSGRVPREAASVPTRAVAVHTWTPASAADSTALRCPNARDATRTRKTGRRRALLTP